MYSQKQLVPGGRIVCQIEFKPNEWRYYYDCVNIIPYVPYIQYNTFTNVLPSHT